MLREAPPAGGASFFCPPEVVKSVRTLSRILAVAALAAPFAASGQTMVGRVLEEGSERPLAGVELLVLDRDGQPVLRGFTDNTGRFQILLPREGRFRVRASLIGHHPSESRVVQAKRGTTVELQVRMGVDAIPLDPVTVVTRRSAEAFHLDQFDARRLDPGRVGGFFMTRDDIERRPAAIVSHLVLEAPGASLSPVNNWGLERNQIQFRGRGGNCSANVYVDGARVNQSRNASIDDLLHPDLVAGVEVYPRASTAPIQYRGETDCGVVLFWTSRPGGAMGGTAPWKLIAGGVLIAGFWIVGIASMAGGLPFP